MDLKCDETLNIIWFRNQVKPLYELTRNKLFYNEYYCEYCDLKDFDFEWMKIHIKYNHDEVGVPTKIFLCKICFESITTEEIIRHVIHTHIK